MQRRQSIRIAAAPEQPSRSSPFLGMMMLLLFLFLAYQIFFHRPKPLTSGTLAPALELKQISTHQAWKPSFQKRVTVLHFWATWCGVCVSELKHVSRRAASLQSQGVQYLLINTDLRDSRGVQSFLQNRRIPSAQWPFHHLDIGNASSLYKVRALPSVVFINPDGKIATQAFGRLPDQSVLDFIKSLQPSQPPLKRNHPQPSSPVRTLSPSPPPIPIPSPTSRPIRI